MKQYTRPTQPWYETFFLLIIGPIGWFVLYLRQRSSRKRFDGMLEAKKSSDFGTEGDPRWYDGHG